MSGSQLDGEPAFPSDSVVVVNPTSWAARPLELGQLLRAVTGWHSRDRVIPDSSGRPPEAMLKLTDPSYWSSHVAELGDALKGTSSGGVPPAGAALGGGAGGVPESPGRLTWTVDEAAVALGISRALAYDAVRRGEIPAIKIGRRILVPRSALNRLVEQEIDPSSLELEGGGTG